MFSRNPDATPIWLLMIFSAIAVIGYPVIKKVVMKYVRSKEMQRLCVVVILLILCALIAAVSVIIYP